ncbi:alpha/beta hydrolase [Streptomyces profundus]|uniref:alpha/beta hydrolase n=1 Tax=Streptomyces profundus TaxID=2867410 RepID=UPI001D163F88|nr:alpha/beta hydrolase [Streptomyces sp. MA3_2.13]UED84317.1 alpha/beta hydrolase [Streptomyces sp. MA3_2.13]
MMISRKSISVGVAATTLIALTAACSSDDSGRPPERAGADQPGSYPELPDALGTQTLDWSDCPTPSAAQDPMATAPPDDLPDGTGWECADLTVPLDYAEPEGDTIDLALNRVVSPAGGEDRIGSLLFNFGGPGGSGVATLPLAAEDYEELRVGGFDLVSFDPRGVGESEGIECQDGPTRDAASQELTGLPDTEAEQAVADRQDLEYVEGCVADSGPLLPHVTTANTARDLDLMRHVLGDERLNYVGISYGSQLGAAYANLFPERVGRTVLDAVVDPDPDPLHQSLLDAGGFQLALDHYLEDCVQRASCPVGDDVAAGTRWLSQLLDDLEEEPLPTDDPDGRLLTSLLAYTGIVSALYSEETWEYLTLGLTEVREQGAGSLLLFLADFYNGRDPATGAYSSQNDSFTAIRCADQPGGMSTEELLAHEEEFIETSEVFGRYMVWGLAGCGEHWPVTEVAEPQDYDATGAAEPILLVATTGDPATPHSGAERMRDAMGGPEVAPLLTYDGEGHGAYTGGDACVVEAVNAHLLTGAVPEDGLVCQG